MPTKKPTTKKNTNHFSPNDRNKKGRFTKGNPGGPGAKPKKQPKRSALDEALTWLEKHLGIR